MYPSLKKGNKANKAKNLGCCLAASLFKVIVDNVINDVVYIENNFNVDAYNCEFAARKVKRDNVLEYNRTLLPVNNLS
jgi:hypothetical protein